MALFLGFFFGVLLMICLYNLHWYNVTKDKSYLYYAIYKLFIILVYLQNTQTIDSNEFALILSANIVFISILLFTKEFLALDVNNKKMVIVIHYTMGFLVLYFIYSTITGDYSHYTLSYSLVLSPLFLLGLFIYLRGYEPAKYYALGWGLSLPLIGLTEINTFNIFDFYPDVPFSLIANVIESIILTYAISVKTHLIIKEKEAQSKILIHQAKLASMGQMLENISHQWRQPLHRISTFIINMQVYLEGTYKDEKYLPKTLMHTQEQLEYMSNTITDFTNFNKQTQDKEHFLASSVFDLLVSIIGQSLEKNNIDFKLEIEEDFSIYSYPNELGQVLLNLIQNAQDAIVEREVKEPVIRVIIHKNSIEVEDNAGGIDTKIAQQMFEPYFSTKSKSTSMGLGLYMSETIIKQYFKAKIELSQSKDKTTFKIFFT